MSTPIAELADLTGTDFEPEVVAVLEAVRQIEAAELLLRGRIRARLGLNSSDLTALRFIYRSERENTPARPRDLGRRLAVTSAAATNIADRLCRAELVEKRLDPTDGRGRILVLSPGARQKLDDALSETQQMLDTVLTSIVSPQAEYILGLLQAVTAALNSGAEDLSTP